MKVTVLVLVCQVTSHTTIALRFSHSAGAGWPIRERYSYRDDLLLIDAVRALEGDEQPFLFVLRRALQRFLVTPDE